MVEFLEEELAYWKEVIKKLKIEMETRDREHFKDLAKCKKAKNNVERELNHLRRENNKIRAEN